MAAAHLPHAGQPFLPRSDTNAAPRLPSVPSLLSPPHDADGHAALGLVQMTGGGFLSTRDFLCDTSSSGRHPEALSSLTKAHPPSGSLGRLLQKKRKETPNKYVVLLSSS